MTSARVVPAFDVGEQRESRLGHKRTAVVGVHAAVSLQRCCCKYVIKLPAGTGLPK